MKQNSIQYSIYKKINFFFLIILFLCNTEVFASEEKNSFVFNDKPINPACVALFDSSEADFPYINSVILNVCQGSNAAYQETHIRDKNIYYFYTNNKNANEGEYSYQVRAEYGNNIYAVETSHSGGGSGVFSDLLLIKIENANIFNKQHHGKKREYANEPIMQMRLLGYIVGGDRCSGGFKTINIKGDELIIERYLQNNHVLDCNKTNIETYHLTEIKNN